MSSTSPAQARLMAARAHGWSPKHPRHPLPPVGVARDFNKADTGTEMLSEGMDEDHRVHKAHGGIIRCPHCGKHHYADGGPVPQDVDPLGTLEKDKKEVTPEEEPGGLPVYQGENVKKDRDEYLREHNEDLGTTESLPRGPVKGNLKWKRRPGYSEGGTVSPVYEGNRENYRRQEEELDDYGHRYAPGEGDAFAQHLVRRKRMKSGGQVPRR